MASDSVFGLNWQLAASKAGTTGAGQAARIPAAEGLKQWRHVAPQPAAMNALVLTCSSPEKESGRDTPPAAL